ncbi:MAG: BamA/TamA family outer membrane protein [Labilithrix sp.]|nr:BamA/TamA family outer membrane protein [Labilithrix sp.]
MKTRSLVLVVAAALVLLGCNTIPRGRTAVTAVQVRGADRVSADDVKDKIATTASPKFLGLFRGVFFEYAMFDRFVLQRDLARVEAYYRARGFFDARARAGRVHDEGGQRVRVEIVVEEGEPVLVRRVTVEGVEGVTPNIAADARASARAGLRRDALFDDDAYRTTEGNVRRALTDAGYAYAKVKSDAAVDIVARRADVVYTVTPGPRCVFGPVTIDGLGDLPDAPVRRALDIQPGRMFSQKQLDGAQQAVLDLGVFASVEIIADIPDEPPEGSEDAKAEAPIVPIKVKVEPTRLRTVRLGGGVELDALKTDVHGVFGWEHRNFLGGLRSFAVSLRPGVVVYPLRVNNIVEPERLLPEGRLRVDFKQPGLFEPRTNGFIRPELAVYPLLLNPDPAPGSRVLGYVEGRNSAGVERTFWRFFGSISHNFQVAAPFGYVGGEDPNLELITIFYPELFTTLDLRDDKIHPRKGIYVGNTLQIAGGPFGGKADDVKIQPDFRGFIPISSRVVLAARVSVGFLAPRNYGDVVRQRPSTFETQAGRTKDYQLTFFRGFFSGGPTSNRGYPIRGIGPHDIVPFLTPELARAQLELGCGDQCRSPTGGFTLWEASTEIRINVAGPFSVATFCDASDVSPRTVDIRLDHPHLSCGGGARYDTPVGPIRLDVGYRIPGMQVIGGLTPDEREPTLLFGIPIAVHIGIGEAY